MKGLHGLMERVSQTSYEFTKVTPLETTPAKKKSLNRDNPLLLPMASGVILGTLGADLFLLQGKGLTTLSGQRLTFLKSMAEDIAFLLQKDPSVKNALEAFLTTPGLHAVWIHRIAHQLYQWHVPIVPRVLASFSRFLTGIEIHPAATLGKQVFIDHTGAIIGETAILEDNVMLVGRVCLGATGKQSGARHPIIKQGTTLGMDSMVIGRVTVGEQVQIGAGALVLHSVPDRSTVVGNPAKVIRLHGKRLDTPIPLKQLYS